MYNNSPSSRAKAVEAKTEGTLDAHKHSRICVEMADFLQLQVLENASAVKVASIYGSLLKPIIQHSI